jgi:arginase family enzyme
MGSASVLVVPQWQGAIRPQAPRLAAGAAQLAGLARAGGRAVREVTGLPGTRSPVSHGVDSYQAILAAQALTARALLVPPVPVAAAAVVLAGTRAVDAQEQADLGAAGIEPLGMRALAEPQVAAAALRRTGRAAVHVHLDLDVLDPAVFPHTTYAEPGGATVGQVVALLRAAGQVLPVCSAFIGEHLGADATAARAAGPLVTELLTLLDRQT